MEVGLCRNVQTLILGDLQSEIIKGAVMAGYFILSIMLTCTILPYFCYGT